MRNEELLTWLHPVQDPEMFISVVDLGLIYVAEFVEGKTKSKGEMTLTSPHCPVADSFVENVRKRLLEYPGMESAEVKLVFEPKWDPKTMASD